MMFGVHAYEKPYPVAPLSLPILAEGLQQVGFVASLSNVVTALSALTFVILALAALVHKKFWPLLGRPNYALQRISIARRTKFLGSLGVALLGIGLGVVPIWLMA
jgi:hypothetical protein